MRTSQLKALITAILLPHVFESQTGEERMISTTRLADDILDECGVDENYDNTDDDEDDLDDADDAYDNRPRRTQEKIDIRSRLAAELIDDQKDIRDERRSNRQIL